MARKNQKAPWEEEEEIIWVSRTEMKEDMEALQKMGVELVELKPPVLAKMTLDEGLHEAILNAQRFKNEAKRRQLQYIGKLMRQLDPEPIQAELDRIRNKHNQATAELHKIEQLRDRIISEGDSAITQLINEHPSADRQRVRLLARQANKEKQANKPPKASRELFKLIKELSL